MNALEVTMKPTVLVVGIVLSCTAAVLAQTPWIHVDVDESGEDAAHVQVHLPLSVVRIAMEAAPENILSEGELHLSHVDQDLDIESLRRLWRELRKVGDSELVSVEKPDEIVRVRREGDYVLIDVEERAGESPEQVHIEIPVTVVDALFSGEGETLNVADALSELSTERGEIVRVDDGETRVRIWIDERE